jgi:hypothetical protein
VIDEAEQKDEDTGKLYYCNKYEKFRLKHWKENKKPEHLAPSYLLSYDKLQGQGDIKWLSASAFLFEIVTSYKTP